MATNLRLRHDAAAAVRQEAERTGRSQQDVIREAVDRYLALSPARSADEEVKAILVTKGVIRCRSPYRKAASRLALPPSLTVADLLDRGDRI